MTTNPTKKWTKGPWSAHKHGSPELDNEEWIILSDSPGANEGDALIAIMNTLDGEDAHLIAAAPDLAEVAEFYADPANFIIMDDRWYEFDEANVDLTRYAPIGTKAQKALAKVRGET